MPEGLNVTTDNRPLTPLEGAMLGFYLMGAGWVDFYETEYGYSADLCDRDNLSWVCIESIFLLPNVPDDIPGLNTELLPWLESHNIPIPEVKV